jgi:hypothetical protein
LPSLAAGACAHVLLHYDMDIRYYMDIQGPLWSNRLVKEDLAFYLIIDMVIDVCNHVELQYWYYGFEGCSHKFWFRKGGVTKP